MSFGDVCLPSNMINLDGTHPCGSQRARNAFVKVNSNLSPENTQDNPQTLFVSTFRQELFSFC